MNQPWRRLSTFLFAILLVCLSLAPTSAADLVEFLSGRKVTGKVLAIRKEKKEFDFRYQIAGRDLTKTYPFSQVHAVTLSGKRYVLTARSTTSGGNASSRGATGAASSVATGGSRRVSRTEIKRLIKQAGETPPEWFENTPLNYPKSLDLAWPLKPPQKGWNNQKNMGQYIWDIINPNPGRWRGGIKLVHHCLSLHQGKPQLVERDMTTLGRMYFTLLQDYPRAAYWFERANVSITKPAGAMLAECYWRMGNREMAEEMLRSRTLPLAAIKLFGDLGRVDDAVKWAKLYESTNSKNDARILAADALRNAGRTREALKLYQQVADSNEFRNAEYERRSKGRARDSIAAIQLQAKAQVERVADGRHSGNAIGYNGRLDVAVTVKDKKIVSVEVTNHREKQFYSAINDTTAQIERRQGVEKIDATTGATITSQAIVSAAAKALAAGAQ